jgi:hypothetical protein
MATVNLGRIKFVWQGAYSGATAYVADDVVSYNGSSYICILASTGNLPTNATYWSLMAQSGTDITSLAGLAQGDVLYYNGTSWVRLGAGTSGQFLQTNGASANPSWGTVSQKILQLQHTEISTQPSRSSGTTFSDITGLSFTITPASASNKVLVTLSIGKVANTSISSAFRLLRTISGTSTALGGTPASSRQGAWVSHWSDSVDGNHDNGLHASYLDSPSTTSAITYQVQWISQGTVYLNRNENDGDGNESYQVRTNSRLFGMEIGA